MSVFVKGMELPKDCRECPMEFYRQFCGDTMCLATDRTLAEDHKIIPFDGRPDWCPLVEIPEPHGDLIDRDELAKNTILCVTHPPYITATDIKNASTVIPREDGENHDES